MPQGPAATVIGDAAHNMEPPTLSLDLPPNDQPPSPAVSSTSIPSEEWTRDSRNQDDDLGAELFPLDEHHITTAAYKLVAVKEQTIGQVTRHNTISSIIADCAVVVLTIGFIAFVIAVWRLDGSPNTSSSQNAWENAITIFATIFPILFASVTSRSISQIARWKLERGATVGCLEQLNSSRTVGAAFLSLLQLRLFNIPSLALLITWAMSPLGTQSLLRMTNVGLSSQSTNSSILYFDSRADSTLWHHGTASPASRYVNVAYFRTLASLYASLVFTPEAIKKDTMDLWGNVKIPYFVAGSGTTAWTDRGLDNDTVEYSSLAGIPVKMANENATFEIESSYVSLDCTSLNFSNMKSLKLSPSEYVLSSMLNTAASTLLRHDEIFYLPNGTWHGYNKTTGASNTTSDWDSAMSWTLALDRFVDPVWTNYNKTMGNLSWNLNYTDPYQSERGRPFLFRNETDIDAGPTSLLFETSCVTHFADARPELRAHCGVTHEYVESRVNCSRVESALSPRCSVVAQRPSQRRNAPESISPLSFPQLFSCLSLEMPQTTGKGANHMTDASLYYLQDPYLKGMSERLCFTYNITARTLGPRLGQLINSYLTLSQLSLQDRTGVSNTNQTTVAEITRTFTVYDISTTWAILCVMSGVALFTIGLVGIVCKHWAGGPEVLGYVSTVFRDSKFIEIPPDSRRLHGMELSKAMKDLEICYGTTGVTDEGDPLLGVGLKEETQRARESH